MTVLIDSWAWIEFFQGSNAGAAVMGYLDDDQDLIISAVNLAEVYRWILHFYDERIAEEKKAAMKERCLLIDVDEEIAVEAARSSTGSNGDWETQLSTLRPGVKPPAC